MVTFLIGKDHKNFIIHKEFTRKYAEAFCKVFGGDFFEKPDEKYTLEDTSVEAFRLFSQYLYSQKITLALHGWRPFWAVDQHNLNDEDHQKRCSEQSMTLLELWVLADSFKIRELQSEVMEHLLRTERACGTLSPENLHFVYDKTPEGSALRRFVVDKVTWGIDDAEYFKQHASRFPPEMLVDLVVNFSKAVPQKVLQRRYGDINGATQVYFLYKDDE